MHGRDAIKYTVNSIVISKIKKQLNISINVIGFSDSDGKAPYPICCSQHVSETGIDLLYWNSHFAWIQKLFQTNVGHH